MLRACDSSMKSRQVIVSFLAGLILHLNNPMDNPSLDWENGLIIDLVSVAMMVERISSKEELAHTSGGNGVPTSMKCFTDETATR